MTQIAVAKKRIAIIGSGISGLTCAYLLSRKHHITLFEANNYLGGHTATVDIVIDGNQLAVDTGFIVFNDRTYPNFIKMDVEGHEVKIFEGALEYFTKNKGRTNFLVEVHPHFYDKENDFAKILREYAKIGE